MANKKARAADRRPTPPPDRKPLLVAAGAAAAGLLVILIAGFMLLGGSGSKAGPSGPALANGESIHQAQGGQWTNVTPDRLAEMLKTKDFTLLNVKTPYIGEISGTDLYIPYDQLTARAAELPTAKNAKIFVYCRTGTTSAIAAQTLLGLGYTNVWNLDGGMVAWESSGRTLEQKSR
jgi:rhodanese-related sulfurtransferase